METMIVLDSEANAGPVEQAEKVTPRQTGQVSEPKETIGQGRPKQTKLRSLKGK